MNQSRRHFLQASAVGAGTLLAACKAEALAKSARSGEPKPPAEPKKVLILGGTGFIGPALVELCKAQGHTITLFNRGKHNTELFPELEKLHGDRDPSKGEGIKSLAGRKWDIVFDDCGYFPRHVQASAELMAPNIGHYVYVSSISCYAKTDTEGADETAELAKLADPKVETMGDGYANYGGLKALCEAAAEKALPGRVTIVRPGYIVGPGDPTDRFTYWPVRFAKGGDVLVPGTKDDPIQVIDVRDLSAFLLSVGETKTVGVFNACGPEKKLAWGTVIEGCQKLAKNDAKAHWVSVAELRPLGDLDANFPIWAPHEGETKGFHTCSNARAVKAGMRFRSIDATLADTLAWFQTLPEERRAKLGAGPSAEKERELLTKLKRI